MGEEHFGGCLELCEVQENLDELLLVNKGEVEKKEEPEAA